MILCWWVGAWIGAGAPSLDLTHPGGWVVSFVICLALSLSAARR